MGPGALLLAIVAAHALLGLWLVRRTQPLLPPPAPTRIELVLIEPESRALPPPPSPRPRRHRQAAVPAVPPAPVVPRRADAAPDDAPVPEDAPAIDTRTLLRQAAAAERAAQPPTIADRQRPRLPGREQAFVEGIAVRGTRSPQQWVALVGRLLGAEDPCVDLMRRRVAAVDVDEVVDVERRLARRNCRLE